VIVSKLSPYSNYTIAVRAFTKIGNGNYSDQKYFNTEIDGNYLQKNILHHISSFLDEK
jgi:hypothetical protein